MDRLIKLYVYTHVHIALCAVSLFCGGYALRGGSLLTLPYNAMLHIGCSTLLVYTAHRWLGRHKMSPSSASDNQRYTFSRDHEWMMMMMMAVVGLVALITFFELNLAQQICLAVGGALSGLYVYPIVFGSRLRDFGIAKLLLIGITWASMPVVGSLAHTTSAQLILLFFENLLFIIALTIPFEIKDANTDHAAHVHNITERYTQGHLEKAAYLCLIAAALLVFVCYLSGLYGFGLMVAILTLYLLLYWMMMRIRPDTGELFFLFWLDGLMMLKGILYLALS